MDFDHNKYTNSFMESLSSQYDLQPEPCDNVDPKEELNKKIKFMQSRIEEVLNGKGDYNSEDISLKSESEIKNEFDLDELQESFSFIDKFSTFSKIKNPSKIIDSIKKKFSPMVERIVGRSKVREISKNAKDDTTAIMDKYKKAKIGISNKSEQKKILMNVAKNHIKEKYHLEEEKGSVAYLMFNGVLFLVFLNFLRIDIEQGNEAQIMLDIVIGLWCLYDTIKEIILLMKNKK